MTAAGADLTIRHPVERFRLDNGLRVVLAPDRSVPVVAVTVFYDVGMRNEPEGRTGFAHLFEHLMFQGSAHVPKMEHARLVQAAGGTFNGSTHQDYTNYYEALPSEALERALFLEADRMASPAITAENLRNQIDVVKEEIRVNVLNRPYGAFPWLQLPPVAFESFANTHDGYGSFVDLESSTVEDAADFFDKYYAPGNAVLCVGGDLDVAETERLVQRWFGAVQARDVPPTAHTGEPSPTTVRSAVVEDRLAPAPAVALGWRVPDPVGDLDTYLGTVLLAELLSEGDASRLERRLVHDDQLAVAQSSYVGLFGDPFDVRDATLLTTQVHHPAAVPVDAVVAAVHDEIGRVAAQGVEPEELARVQARAEAQLLRQADSVLGRTLGFAAAELVHGRAELAGELAARLAAVGPEQVQAAAKGLDPGTVAVLELQATGGRR
ncbi:MULTISPECIES: M16 family metallopeptidase [unclassified Blastococcus]